MRRALALTIDNALYFVVVPGTVSGLVPRLFVGWRVQWSWTPAQIIAMATICLGLVPLVGAFVAFARAGGTPSPGVSPDHLVVDGFYLYVRNPIYVGVLLTIMGQALLFKSALLVAYAVLFWIAVASFVRWYEEPGLSRQFGAAYHAYRQSVPAWCPRLRPWIPEA